MKTYPQGNLCENVHSNLIHNSPKLEATQMTINSKMDKQIVVDSYNGIHRNQTKQSIGLIYGDGKGTDSGW